MKEIKIDKSYVKKLIIKRDEFSNKYDFGRVLIVAGSYPMSGACFLAAKSALKAGCGVVVCVVVDKIKPVISTLLPEAIVYSGGKGDYVDNETFCKVVELSRKKRFDLLLIGPGIGDDEKTGKIVIKIIRELSIPVVIDADGITALKRESDLSFLKNIPNIITPHSGEAKKFVGFDGIKSLYKMIELTGGVVVLKDYKTFIGDGKKLFSLDKPNSALAKAGSGDVLGGIITGLWASYGKKEGFNLKTALKSAITGTYIHSLAGKIMSLEKTKFSLIASELIEAIPLAFKEIE